MLTNNAYELSETSAELMENCVTGIDIKPQLPLFVIDLKAMFVYCKIYV